MWARIALLVSPLLPLGEMTLAYALTTPLCARQAGHWLHALAAAFVAVAAALAAASWRETFRPVHQPAEGADTGTDGRPRALLGWMGAGMALLATLVLLALWIPQWLLSPCTS